jgi:hypothetical protein
LKGRHLHYPNFGTIVVSVEHRHGYPRVLGSDEALEVIPLSAVIVFNKTTIVHPFEILPVTISTEFPKKLLI